MDFFHTESFNLRQLATCIFPFIKLMKRTVTSLHCEYQKPHIDDCSFPSLTFLYNSSRIMWDSFPFSIPGLHQEACIAGAITADALILFRLLRLPRSLATSQ